MVLSSSSHRTVNRVIRTTENMWKLQETRLCCNKTSMTAAWIFCSAAFHINTKYGIIKTNIAERCHIWPLLWIACMSKHKYCFSITHLWAQHVLEIWTPSPEDVRGKTINVTLQTETSHAGALKKHITGWFLTGCVWFIAVFVIQWYNVKNYRHQQKCSSPA